MAYFKLTNIGTAKYGIHETVILNNGLIITASYASLEEAKEARKGVREGGSHFIRTLVFPASKVEVQADSAYAKRNLYAWRDAVRVKGGRPVFNRSQRKHGLDHVPAERPFRPMPWAVMRGWM